MKNKVRGKTERVKILWVHQYSEKLNYRNKISLLKIFRTINIKFTQSVSMFITDFLRKTEDESQNMILRYKSRFAQDYSLLITPKFIKLIKNYGDTRRRRRGDILFQCSILAENEIHIFKYNRSSFIILKRMCEEILKESRAPKLNASVYNRYKHEW